MTDEENKELWDNYFYPGTTVLINNLNIKDGKKLKMEEVKNTFEKLLELRNISLNIEIDKNRLNYIHWYIFKDVYSFAGKYRKVNMRKHNGIGSFLEIDDDEDIDRELNKLFKKTNEILRRCHNKEDFCDVLSKLYTSLIFIHPYREGNGRTVREFIREFSIVYSDKLGIGQMELDWSLINREELDEFIDVAHRFPDYISSIFMNALVSSDGKRR